MFRLRKGVQKKVAKSPAEQIEKKISSGFRTDELQAEILADIEALNGNTQALSELVVPSRYAVGCGEKLCILSIVGSNVDKFGVFLPIAKKLVAAGADVHKLSNPLRPAPLERFIDRQDTENYPRLSPLACCFAYCYKDDTAEGVIGFAKVLAEGGVNFAQDPTAFVLACLRYEVDLVEYLLKNGADANSKLPNGMPASLVLVQEHIRKYHAPANENSNQTEWKERRRDLWARMTRLLLEHGADPPVVRPHANLTSAKYSLLSAAIAIGDVDLSKEMLEMGATLVHYDTDTFLYTNGSTPTCGHLTPLNECLVRIAQGQEEMLGVFYMLLDKGADLKAGGTGSYTYNRIWNPTLLCTTIGCAFATGGNAALREVVGVMLDKGVDVEEEVYALCLAAISLDTELFEILLKNGFDTEDCRNVDALIPTLGPNHFQISSEKIPGYNGGDVANEVKVNLLMFVLKSVHARAQPEEMVLNMVKCLLRNGVDMNTIVEPTKNSSSERINALKFALTRGHMSTALFLLEKGIALKVDESEELISSFGRALANKKDLKTAKLLVSHAKPELLNTNDEKGLTPLGYAAFLSMHANERLAEPEQNRFNRAPEVRVYEGETDEERQWREKDEEDERKRKQEREARQAAEDAQLKDLINAMLDAGSSPFVLQADKDWDSRYNYAKVSLLEICARRQRWRQLEILVTHPASSSGRSKDFVGPLVMALVARAAPRIVRMLLDRVDSVLEQFVFKKPTSAEDSDEEDETEEDDQPCVRMSPVYYGTWYSVRTGMSVLTCAGGSRLENLKIVVERANKEKVSVNTRDSNGSTLLSTFLTELPRKYEDGIKLLLDAEADPSIKTGPNSVDSLMLASARTDVSRTLPSDGSRWSRGFSLPSHISFFIENRTPAALQLLRDHGSPFSTKDKDGKTAFHYACHSGSTRLVEWYLDTFTEDETAKYINLAVPESGMTPTMLISSVRGSHSIIPRLVAAGADLSSVASNGATALSLAVTTRASTKMALALLANGADPNKGTHPLIASTKQRPRVWYLIHKLIDETDINQAIAQEALNHLLIEKTSDDDDDDPYEDFRVHARCGLGHAAEMRRRRERAQQETQSIMEKLVHLGAKLKFARRAAKKAQPRVDR